MDNIRRFFPTISVNLDFPDECLESASVLAKLYPPTNLDKFSKTIENSKEHLKILCENKRKTYETLIDGLIDCAINGQL